MTVRSIIRLKQDHIPIINKFTKTLIKNVKICKELLGLVCILTTLNIGTSGNPKFPFKGKHRISLTFN